MEFTKKHNDLVYGALEIFLDGDSPSVVSHGEDGLIKFSTVLGLDGSISQMNNGGAMVILDNEEYYFIEKEIYEIMIYRDKVPPIGDLLKRLFYLNDINLQKKSKILIENILSGIVKIVWNQEIEEDVEFKFGPFWKSNSENLGNLKIILN